MCLRYSRASPFVYIMHQTRSAVHMTLSLRWPSNPYAATRFYNLLHKLLWFDYSFCIGWITKALTFAGPCQRSLLFSRGFFFGSFETDPRCEQSNRNLRKEKSKSCLRSVSTGCTRKGSSWGPSKWAMLPPSSSSVFVRAVVRSLCCRREKKKRLDDEVRFRLARHVGILIPVMSTYSSRKLPELSMFHLSGAWSDP